MNTDIARLRGSQVPLVTPFRDGRFDEAAFRDLIEFQIENGSHGIGCTGTSGRTRTQPTTGEHLHTGSASARCRHNAHREEWSVRSLGDRASDFA